MNEDRLARRRAYIAAKTRERAFHERYYPLPVMGGRAAEAVTPEVVLELERLKAVTEAARIAFESPRPA